MHQASDAYRLLFFLIIYSLFSFLFCPILFYYFCYMLFFVSVSIHSNSFSVLMRRLLYIFSALIFFTVLYTATVATIQTLLMLCLSRSISTTWKAQGDVYLHTSSSYLSLSLVTPASFFYCFFLSIFLLFQSLFLSFVSLSHYILTLCSNFFFMLSLLLLSLISYVLISFSLTLLCFCLYFSFRRALRRRQTSFSRTVFFSCLSIPMLFQCKVLTMCLLFPNED